MIVKQDGNLINTKNIEHIYSLGKFVYADTISGSELEIGEYKDEEEAKWAIRFMSKFIHIDFAMPNKTSNENES